MTTLALIDLRRADVRSNVLESPYWITSAEFESSAQDLAAVLFSFPSTIYTRGAVIVHEICCEVTTLWAGGTVTMDIGEYTIATDAAITTDDATEVDPNQYIESADITSGTAAAYWPTTGAWFTARQANTWGTNALITPAATAVPCITASIVSTTTATSGASRVHVLISEIPLMG